MDIIWQRREEEKHTHTHQMRVVQKHSIDQPGAKKESHSTIMINENLILQRAK